MTHPNMTEQNGERPNADFCKKTLFRDPYPLYADRHAFLHKKSRPGGAAETGRREPPVGVWERIYSATVISSVRTTGCGAPSAVQVTVMTVPSGASFAIFS